MVWNDNAFVCAISKLCSSFWWRMWSIHKFLPVDTEVWECKCVLKYCRGDSKLYAWTKYRIIPSSLLPNVHTVTEILECHLGRKWHNGSMFRVWSMLLQTRILRHKHQLSSNTFMRDAVFYLMHDLCLPHAQWGIIESASVLLTGMTVIIYMYMLWYDLLLQLSVIPLFPIACRLGMANELSLYIWCCGCDGSAGCSPLVLSAQEHREEACARGNIPHQLWPLRPLLLLQDPIYSVIFTSHYNLLEGSFTGRKFTVRHACLNTVRCVYWHVHLVITTGNSCVNCNSSVIVLYTSY